MASVGKRTSVYLSDGLAAAVAESGVPLAELIRRGLAAVAPSATRLETPGEIRAKVTRAREAAELGKAIAAERRQSPVRRRCPHPGTRMIGGWCRQCGVMVEPDGYLPG